MMCMNKNKDEVGKRENDKIERELRVGKEEAKNCLKLLLLGAGDSGKSTIFKQVKILKQKGFQTPEECLIYVDVIFSNLLTVLKTLCMAAEDLAIELDQEENQERAQRIMALSDSDIFTRPKSVLTEEVWRDISVLARDNGIKTAWDNRSKLHIPESGLYFLQNVERFSKTGYVPTQQDILQARVKSTGVVEMEFPLGDRKREKVKIVDMGGQRNERKKWLPQFEDVLAVLFVASLSDYDQVLFEDKHTNRMKESLIIFEEICNSKYLGNVPIFIFFNKKDILKEKIQTVSPSVAFADYTGGLDYQEAVEFIKKKFTSLNSNAQRTLYTHTTCATDTSNMELVLAAVENMLLEKLLRLGGMM